MEWPDVEMVPISLDELNSEKVQQHIRTASPEFLLTYGCHMLSEKTLACAQGEKWNIHGGLSPWYRGAITHFWPSYLLEPQKTGMTVHNLTQELDAGDVVHQCTAPLVKGDGLHQLAAKAVIEIGKELPELLRVVHEKGASAINKIKHKTPGRLWQGSHWQPHHLRLIYQLYDNRIVDYYLDGKIANSEPKLHRQF